MIVRRQRYWDEVEAGQELPTISLPITFQKVSMTPFATWDFFPGHSERGTLRLGIVPSAHLASHRSPERQRGSGTET